MTGRDRAQLRLTFEPEELVRADLLVAGVADEARLAEHLRSRRQAILDETAAAIDAAVALLELRAALYRWRPSEIGGRRRVGRSAA